MNKKIFKKYIINFIICFIAIRFLQYFNQYNFLSFIFGCLITSFSLINNDIE